MTNFTIDNTTKCTTDITTNFTVDITTENTIDRKRNLYLQFIVSQNCLLISLMNAFLIPLLKKTMVCTTESTIERIFEYTEYTGNTEHNNSP